MIFIRPVEKKIRFPQKYLYLLNTYIFIKYIYNVCQYVLHLPVGAYFVLLASSQFADKWNIIRI